MKVAVQSNCCALRLLILPAVFLFLAGCGKGGGPVAAIESAKTQAADSPPPPPAPPTTEAVAPTSVETAQAAESSTTEPAADAAPSTSQQETPPPTSESSGAAPDVQNEALAEANPFPRRLPAPEFPKHLTWLNSKPLTKEDLKGKFVLLDFWTYCCINCMHVLPELKKLEKEFDKNLVVIGVHSAKFEAEKVTENIRDAILRYEIEHAVINDANHELWDTYGVSSWPTIGLIDPEGMFVGGQPGEFKAQFVRDALNRALPYYREKKLLDETPLKLDLEAEKEARTPLRFPGKVLADEKGNRLFISDSNHNRIVIATLDGKLLDVIGSGAIGREDGEYKSATFNHPQGCALSSDVLYVADTENHLLRKVDLKSKMVTTIAGTGEQAAHSWPGLEEAQAAGGKPPDRWIGPPATTALNSPWALWIHKSDLFIANAGSHQIWKMPLDASEIGPYAGNGREDIVDGNLLPKVPYMEGFSSFAQPSGLSSDGTWLYVADSEGSSVRAVPFDPKRDVRTVIGSDHLPGGRLFAFGDKDGAKSTAKLQHCLEVVYLSGKIYVADTYNHKIKVVDARSGETKTLAGIGKPGKGDSPAEFHEPAGLAVAKGKLIVADTNNHLLRTIDLVGGKVATLAIEGLTAPATPGSAAQP